MHKDVLPHVDTAHRVARRHTMTPDTQRANHNSGSQLHGVDEPRTHKSTKLSNMYRRDSREKVGKEARNEPVAVWQARYHSRLKRGTNIARSATNCSCTAVKLQAIVTFAAVPQFVGMSTVANPKRFRSDCGHRQVQQLEAIQYIEPSGYLCRRLYSSPATQRIRRKAWPSWHFALRPNAAA